MPALSMYAAAAILYAALAVYFWKRRWQSPPIAAVLAPFWERVAVLLPITLHAGLLYEVTIAASLPRIGFGLALSATLWLSVLVYWAENLFFRVEGLEPPLFASAAICVPLPLVFPGLASSTSSALAPELRAHLLFALVAYSLFVIAVLHAVLMLLLERRLHGARDARKVLQGAMVGPLAHWPPLLTLERLLFRVIMLAFLFLTLTLGTGIAFSETVFDRAMRFDHKTLFSVLAWLTFGALLVGRWRWGWRGRVAIRGTVTGFALLMLAYVGSRFVLEVLLQRG
jgi:ABC-type uncharacterized transport system permease subunit